MCWRSSGQARLGGQKVFLLFWRAVVLDEAVPLVELDHVLQTKEVSMVDSQRYLFRQRDWLQPVLKQTQSVSN